MIRYNLLNEISLQEYINYRNYKLSGKYKNTRVLITKWEF